MSPTTFGTVARKWLESGNSLLKDPGNGGMLGSGYGEIPHDAWTLLTLTTASHTRTLPPVASLPVGFRMNAIIDNMTADDAVTISGVTLADEGHYARFEIMQYNSTKSWVCIGSRKYDRYMIPLNQLRVWNDFDSFLPETAADDDLGFIEGTFGTTAPLIKSVDFGGTATQAYARVQAPVPGSYVAGGALRMFSNAYTQVLADAQSGLTFNVYRAAAPTTDIAAAFGTATANVNTITTTNTATVGLLATNVVPGDVLDIRLQYDGEDAGNLAANINLVIASLGIDFTCVR